MTDQIDEHLLTAAKLREQIGGDLEGDPRLLDHAGLLPHEHDRAVLTFVEQVFPDTFAGTELGNLLNQKALNDTATEAVHTGNGSVMSHLVGVTEQDFDASALRLPMLLLDELDNNEAPAFPVAAGNPNTGKTNTMLLLAELAKADLDDLLVLANFDSSLTDHRVTSAHDLTVTLLEHRDVPKFVIIDEGSTHFDARTYRREVATQYTPLAKRFAKVGVYAAGIICHTGKDLHPEAKRLATLPFYKSEKKVAEFYENWPADEDFPTDRLFSGELENLEKSAAEYSPDDAAPWSWDLEPELFSLDLDWPALLDELHERGPAE